MQVKHVEAMRRKLPEDCSMVVTKNRLLRVAVDSLGEDGVRWEGLKGQKGMNAFVFAPEDSIRGAVNSYSKLFETLKVCFKAARGQPILHAGQICTLAVLIIEPPGPENYGSIAEASKDLVNLFGMVHICDPDFSIYPVHPLAQLRYGKQCCSTVLRN
jgi:ribosomal protein L10